MKSTRNLKENKKNNSLRSYPQNASHSKVLWTAEEIKDSWIKVDYIFRTQGLKQQWFSYRQFLDADYAISKEEIKRVIDRVNTEDFYHMIGKPKVWSLSNDAVVDETQEFIHKWLLKELGLNK